MRDSNVQPLAGIRTALLLASLLGTPALAQSTPPAPPPSATPPCQGAVWWADTGATYADFDFWVGEWQAFDRKSGRLLGLDVIEKDLGGCLLTQRWRQFDDRYKLPGVSHRLRGAAYTSLGVDGRWHQIWVDNSGSWIPVRGGLDTEGTMVLESDWQQFTNRQGQTVRLRYRWQWHPRADGTIHSWGEIGTPDDDAIAWTPSFDILYRRNEYGGPQTQLDQGKPSP